MKKLFIFLAILLLTPVVQAQPDDGKQMHETGKTFMRQGDFDNASLLLNRALQHDPGNIEILKDLALNYYLQKDNVKALDIVKAIIDRNDADDQCYQIAGNVYRASGQDKECEKLYKKGLKKFPQSGPLYNEYGELLMAMENTSAIKLWEKGIESDAGYSGNYYNAAKHYYLAGDRLWSIIYGEIFLNIETLTGRTAEIKNLVADSYKKLFAGTDIFSTEKTKNSFEQAFLQILYKQHSIAASGINPETLTMIRTRFILDWYNSFSKKFPFRLFDYHLQLLREGMFDAYNQWIFGAAQNLVAYQDWTTAHSAEYGKFQHFQKGRVFKMQVKQYYH